MPVRPPVQVIKAVAYSLAFSPDGKLLVTANDFKEARVWDVHSGKQLCSLPAGKDSIVCMVFSADGRRLALGSKDHFITIWNTVDWKRIRSLHTQFQYRDRPLRFGPDGKTLVTVFENYIRSWDIETGRLLKTQPNPFKGKFATIVSPNGKRFAVKGYSGNVELHDLPSGKTILLNVGLKGWYASSIIFGKPWWHPNRVRQPVFSPNSALLAASSSRNKGRLWRVPSGREVCSFDAFSVAFSPDSKTLAVGDNQGIVRLLDTRTGKEKEAFVACDSPMQSETVGEIQFSPDGRSLATTSDADVRLWDVAGR